MKKLSQLFGQFPELIKDLVIAYPQLDVHFDETFTKAAGIRPDHIEER
jgi:hypothetical protein